MSSGVISGIHSAVPSGTKTGPAAVAMRTKDSSYPVCFDGGEGSARLSSSGIEITTQASGFEVGMTVRIHVLLRQVHGPGVMMHICVSEVETRAGTFLVHARILRVLVETKSVGPHRLPIAKRTGV